MFQPEQRCSAASTLYIRHIYHIVKEADHMHAVSQEQNRSQQDQVKRNITEYISALLRLYIQFKINNRISNLKDLRNSHLRNESSYAWRYLVGKSIL